MAKFVVESVANGLITVRVPGMNYRNTFQYPGSTQGASVGLAEGQRLRATVHAPAWKLDRVDLGGNYVEPLYGRPRRMQGTILSINPAANELTVQVGYEVTVQLPEKYRAADYAVGERVGWDNIDIPVLDIQAVLAEPLAGQTL